MSLSARVSLHSTSMIGGAVLVLLTACGGGGGSDPQSGASASSRESYSLRTTSTALAGAESALQLATPTEPAAEGVEVPTTGSPQPMPTAASASGTVALNQTPAGAAPPITSPTGSSEPMLAVAQASGTVALNWATPGTVPPITSPTGAAEPMPTMVQVAATGGATPSAAPSIASPVATAGGSSSAAATAPTHAGAAAATVQTIAPDRLTALYDPTLGLVAPLRIAVEDWSGARSRMAASRPTSNWVANEKTAVETWAAKQRERSDLIGGYIHDYVDPNTGIPLKWDEDVPEPADGSTEQSLRVKQAWVAFVRQQNIKYTLIAARLYRLTSDAAMGDWARKQLDFYAQQYPQWPLRTDAGRARMFRHGLDEAYNVFALIDAARLLRDSSSSAQVQLWNDQLFVPIAVNLQTVTSPMTNIALWQASAMAAIAMQVGDAAMLDKALNGPLGVRTTLSQGVTADHLWFEGSLGYNQYVIDALSKLLVHASLQGRAAGFDREWGDARRLLLATVDLRFEDGTLPSPGDVTGSLMALDDRAYTLLYRVVPTWYGSRAAARSITWEALLDPPVVFGADEPALPPVQTRDFPGIRMAVLRAGTWQAFVHYGQVTADHWQEEALTYELHEGRSRISTDSGTVSYSSPYHLNYFRRAAAQNVPLIDGLGQQRWGAGVVREFSAAAARLIVDHAAYRDDAAVSRTYSVSNTGFSERTTIHVGSASPPRRLGSAFHTDCALSPLSGLSTMSSTTAVPATEATAYWRMQSPLQARGTWSVRLDCGAQSYELRVTAGSGSTQRVYLGKAPTRPLPTERSVVYYETDGTSAEFVAEIRPLQ